MGTPKGKRILGRPRHRWEDNIKTNVREIEWGGMDWIDPAEDRDQWRALVNTVMNLRIPYNVGEFLSSCTTGGFLRTLLYGVCYPCTDCLKMASMAEICGNNI
jgi:hypothetical protein